MILNNETLGSLPPKSGIRYFYNFVLEVLGQKDKRTSNKLKIIAKEDTKAFLSAYVYIPRRPENITCKTLQSNTVQ